MPRFSVVAASLGLAMIVPLPTSAEIHLRWNQAGFEPDAPKTLVAMSDTDLAGQRWTILRADFVGLAEPVRQGKFGPSLVGKGDHTPFPFNHLADFSTLRTPGVYEFVVGGAPPARLQIADAPYAALLAEPLVHLRLMRSGSDVVAPRKPSHLGDARAQVVVPKGDPSDGKWQAATPARAVDVSGGWYDAGDQIKFTLNIAYTTYHLLLAYRLAPELHGRPAADASLPPLLAEAKHGLDYLLRVHPDSDTFVIQVGDERDHEQPYRLPENDALDGARPALCALSRTHMASAAAALALGARTFHELGRAEDATRCEAAALALFDRIHGPDTVQTAFERGQVNDFYHDATEGDQRALAAAELFELTGRRAFLDHAIAQSPPPGTEVSWGEWNWLANLALAPHDAAARERLLAETSGYAGKAATTGRPWGVPGPYVWGSLHRWIGAANAAKLASLRLERRADHEALFRDMLDYTFGRNNWGAGFLFSARLPNTVRNIYGPIYQLLDIFPTGALSEGPGNRATHESLERYFASTAESPLARFDTAAGVFRDSEKDFMCQESTIGGQADIVLMLTLASLPPPDRR